MYYVMNLYYVFMCINKNISFIDLCLCTEKLNKEYYERYVFQLVIYISTIAMITNTKFSKLNF